MWDGSMSGCELLVDYVSHKCHNCAATVKKHKGLSVLRFLCALKRCECSSNVDRLSHGPTVTVRDKAKTSTWNSIK